MKNTPSSKIVQTVFEIQKILVKKNIPLIINDDVEIAKYTNADGVHLGQKDLSCTAARKYLGIHKIIGLSIENPKQALACQEYPVNYFGVGPVFKTNTKIDADKPLGINGLKEITALLTKPVVAIGGINIGNVRDILNTGVAGVAVASSILASSTPTDVAKKMAKLISRNMHHEK